MGLLRRAKRGDDRRLYVESLLRPNIAAKLARSSLHVRVMAALLTLHQTRARRRGSLRVQTAPMARLSSRRELWLGRAPVRTENRATDSRASYLPSKWALPDSKQVHMSSEV
jgi:hypothetical protein